MTILCVLQWSRNCLLLVPIYLNMRFHQFQLPQYEDVRLIRFDQSFARMAVMSFIERLIGRQSLEFIVSGFGVNWFVSGYLSDCFNGNADFPCIEDCFRLILTLKVAKGLVPKFSFEDLCVKKSQLIQQTLEKIEAHQEVFACFSEASWMVKTNVCGLGWIIKDPFKTTIQHGSYSRPFVSHALVAKELALKAAISAALAMGVSRLAFDSDCQELILLLNADGHAIEVDGLSADIRFMRTKLLSISFHLVVSLAMSATVSCNVSSFYGV